MKILVLNYEFPPLGGGAGNATHYLLKEFSKNADLEIDLITSSTDKYEEKQFSDNIKIYYLNIGKKGNLHYQSNKDLLKYSWRAYWLSRKLIKKKKYNLVHAFFGIPCGYVAMKLGLPYIVSLRGSDVPFYNRRFYWFDKLLFKSLSVKIWQKAKAVIANSDGLKSLARQSSLNQQIKVIYNGVDTKEFRPENKLKKKEFIILSTSRFIERKGIQYLIEAFKDFNHQHKNSQLYLVGGGALENKFRQQIRKAELNKKVKFAGIINHNGILPYYQQADVFILPSLNEGMSNAVLEAMACGLPIITTDTGGTRELVDTNNGIIIEKKSSKSIFQALEKLYTDKILLKQIRAKNRQKAEKMSWGCVATAYLTIYRSSLYESK